MRVRIAEWICRIADHYGCSDTVAPLAIMMFDRYVNAAPISDPSNTISDVAGCCIVISAKWDDMLTEITGNQLFTL